MLHIPAYNSLSLLFFQTCFIDDSSHRFTNLPFPNKKSGPKPREFLPFFKPPRGVWLTPWCFPHFFRCEIRLRLGYGSIVALVAQEIRGAAWRIFGWSLGVGHFRGTRPVAFFSTRVALKNRLCWCWCWRGSGKNFQFFFFAGRWCSFGNSFLFETDTFRGGFVVWFCMLTEPSEFQSKDP